jgi:tellurite resistance protein
VGFIAYSRLVPEIDTFGRMLFFSGLFLTLLLFTQALRFLRLKFFLSWWAYSFPLAAISIASLVMFERTGTAFYRDLAVGLLVLLTLIVILLLVKTAMAVKRGAICVPGH